MVNHDKRAKPACWCGNNDLEPFCSEYVRCAQCETVVRARPATSRIYQVGRSEEGLYGREYFYRHQQQYGYPTIEERTRLDLPERCLHWLRAMLKYKRPPGKVLELGCSHGGFVALLRWAGFDACGLELSPAIAEYARKTFGIPVLVGPIEDQNIEAGSLDAIALMDVLEHLPDPAATMALCLNLLKPDGLLLVQTPRYPAGTSHSDMLRRRDPFLDHLKASEHLVLFSEKSIVEFFSRLGAKYIHFEPAIFSHYDQFVVVSRTALRPLENPAGLVDGSPSQRLIRGILDLGDRLSQLETRHSELARRSANSIRLPFRGVARLRRAVRLFLNAGFRFAHRNL